MWTYITDTVNAKNPFIVEAMPTEANSIDHLN
jgi:hypothetical protein